MRTVKIDVCKNEKLAKPCPKFVYNSLKKIAVSHENISTKAKKIPINRKNPYKNIHMNNNFSIFYLAIFFYIYTHIRKKENSQ